MLPIEQELPESCTTFNVIHEDEKWKVVVERNGKFIRETYCLSQEHATVVRGCYVNQFWGGQLN